MINSSTLNHFRRQNYRKSVITRPSDRDNRYILECVIKIYEIRCNMFVNAHSYLMILHSNGFHLNIILQYVYQWLFFLQICKQFNMSKNKSLIFSHMKMKKKEISKQIWKYTILYKIKKNCSIQMVWSAYFDFIL